MEKKAIKRKLKIFSTAIALVLSIFIITLLFFKFCPGFGLYIVKSGSMEPVISTGDIVLTRPAASTHDLAVGNIITFQDDGIMITHRIAVIEGDNIITRGDANEDPDPGARNQSDIKGIYLTHIPYLGYIQHIAQSRYGWFAMIIIPTIILITMIVIEILKESFKDDKAHKQTKQTKKLIK